MKESASRRSKETSSVQKHSPFKDRGVIIPQADSPSSSVLKSSHRRFSISSFSGEKPSSSGSGEGKPPLPNTREGAEYSENPFERAKRLISSHITKVNIPTETLNAIKELAEKAQYVALVHKYTRLEERAPTDPELVAAQEKLQEVDSNLTSKLRGDTDVAIRYMTAGRIYRRYFGLYDDAAQLHARQTSSKETDEREFTVNAEIEANQRLQKDLMGIITARETAFPKATNIPQKDV